MCKLVFSRQVSDKSLSRFFWSTPKSITFHYLSSSVDSFAIRCFFVSFSVKPPRLCRGVKKNYIVKNLLVELRLHMPSDHQAYLQWNGERFLHWPGESDQHTIAVVRLFLSVHMVE